MIKFEELKYNIFNYSMLQIQMSDEYHTPKDLVNKQPLSIGLEVFEKDGGTVESYGSESFQRLNHTPAGDPSKVVLKLINNHHIYGNFGS